MRRITVLLLFCSIATFIVGQDPSAGPRLQLAGLTDSAEVIRDTSGIAHIRASNEHDLIFLQGYTHAQDRFFQMDFLRHVAGGTLAELVGTAALPQDVQLRTCGIRRAAARSMAIQSTRIQAMLQAYADGVNAYVTAHPLPPEYGALGVTQVEPWQPLDSLTIAKLLTFQLNFNTTDLEHTKALMSYQAAGKLLGFDGTKLFFDDLFRAAPFETTSTVVDADSQIARKRSDSRRERAFEVDVKGAEAAERYLNEIKDLEFFKHQRDFESGGGSNSWVVSGRYTASGAPILADDPHLVLNYPSLFYPIHLSAGELDVTGNSFAGTPLVILGHNRWLAWGSTASYADVLDFYQEQIVPEYHAARVRAGSRCAGPVRRRHGQLFGR